MASTDLSKDILAFFERALARDQEKGGDGSRTVRDILDRSGIEANAQAINRALHKLESEDLIECLGKCEGLGNAIFWRLPVPEQKNRLVVIGYLGVKRAYLNMSEEDALRRHLESEWPEGWDEETEAETRKQMSSFEFTDVFGTYHAYGI